MAKYQCYYCYRAAFSLQQRIKKLSFTRTLTSTTSIMDLMELNNWETTLNLISFTTCLPYLI